MLRPRRCDEPDPFCKGRVEVKRCIKAVDVVETNAVGVTAKVTRIRPTQRGCKVGRTERSSSAR